MSFRLFFFVLLVSVVTLASNHDHDPAHELFEIADSNVDGSLSLTEFTNFYNVYFPNTSPVTHAGHNHKRQDTHDHSACPHADDLFNEYDTNNNTLLSVAEFEPMVPELALMRLRECIAPANLVTPAPSSSDCTGMSTGLQLLAALISSFIISCISLFVVITLPVHRDVFEKYVLVPLVAFAVGALIGDAILHLIPIAFEVHSHSDDAGGGDAESISGKMEKYLGPGLIVLLGVLVFFYLERLLNHHHDMLSVLAKKESAGESDDSHSVAIQKSHSETEMTAQDNHDSFSSSSDTDASHEIHSHGFLNLASDFLHNFVDGVAIGAAYTGGFGNGLATTIAVFAHELPQEFGDFAILISSGFSKKRAVLANFLTACTCILGSLVGVGIASSSSKLEKWILAFVAGNFFYVALANMVPELNKFNTLYHHITIFFAMCTGFVIMLLIALYFESFDFC